MERINCDVFCTSSQIDIPIVITGNFYSEDDIETTNGAILDIGEDLIIDGRLDADEVRVGGQLFADIICIDNGAIMQSVTTYDCSFDSLFVGDDLIANPEDNNPELGSEVFGFDLYVGNNLYALSVTVSNLFVGWTCTSEYINFDVEHQYIGELYLIYDRICLRS